ncbi:MAG TPA: GNAT family N-acetyltransferase [Gemmatimonadaceae bacterium]|nr:GNAT family N-acetyltransferase [Gemmatimonadaceae bacterium]
MTSAAMSDTAVVRPARARDTDAIVALVNGFAAARVMLPVSREAIALALHNFVVAVDERDRVIGCGALKEYSPSLAEVASVAVSEAAHGRGVGRSIVRAVEALAAVRGIGELFALTLTPQFFEALGYDVADRACYPEKIRRDCLACARRFACAEVCVRRPLAADALEVAA